MQIQVSGKHVDVGDALGSRISQELEDGIGKYFERGAQDAEVVVSKDGHGFKVDCWVRLASGEAIVTSGLGGDAHGAFSDSLDKLEKRVRRYKRRLKDHHIGPKGLSPEKTENAAREGWREAVDAIAQDPGIDEVILSGGDPLSLATHKLVELTDALRAIPHLRRLRIHSRLPVVLPERVDDELVAWLGCLPWPLAFVIHANHANEFDACVDAALARLRAAGAHLLNQAVLLRGVNDSEDALAALSERSFAAGVMPYYLYQLDRVEGVAHFEVDDATAKALIAALTARLSGYLVPKLVRELPGDPSKRPV